MAIVTFSPFLSDPSDNGLRIEKPASFSQPTLTSSSASCFNECVIMRLLVKLDFAADLNFPRIIILL